MKNLNIAVEMSSIAMDTILNPQSPKEVLQRATCFLNEKIELMGQFIACKRIDQRNLADDLCLENYDLTYEKHTLHMQFLLFKPRGVWQVKGFSMD